MMAAQTHAPEPAPSPTMQRETDRFSQLPTEGYCSVIDQSVSLGKSKFGLGGAMLISVMATPGIASAKGNNDDFMQVTEGRYGQESDCLKGLISI